MVNNKIEEMLNPFVGRLCRNCGEDGCPKTIVVDDGNSVLPHCYRKRDRVTNLMLLLVEEYPEMSDATVEKIDQYLGEIVCR